MSSCSSKATHRQKYQDRQLILLAIAENLNRILGMRYQRRERIINLKLNVNVKKFGYLAARFSDERLSRSVFAAAKKRVKEHDNNLLSVMLFKMEDDSRGIYASVYGEAPITELERVFAKTLLNKGEKAYLPEAMIDNLIESHTSSFYCSEHARDIVWLKEARV